MPKQGRGLGSGLGPDFQARCYYLNSKIQLRNPTILPVFTSQEVRLYLEEGEREAFNNV